MKNKQEVMKDLATVRRRQIVIQKRTVTTNGKGNATEDWKLWRTLWVERGELWGAEYFAAKAVNEENTVEFIVKYVDFIREINTKEYQIIYDSKPFDIKKIDYLKDDGTFVKIKALGRD